MREITRRTNTKWDPTTIASERSAPAFNHVSKITGSVVPSIIVTIHSDATGPCQVTISNGDRVQIFYNSSGTIRNITGDISRIGQIRGDYEQFYLELFASDDINPDDRAYKINCDDIRSISVIQRYYQYNHCIYCNVPVSYINEIGGGLNSNITIYGVNGKNTFTAPFIMHIGSNFLFYLPNGLVDGVYTLYAIITSAEEDILEAPSKVGYVFIDNGHNLVIPFSISPLSSDVFSIRETFSASRREANSMFTSTAVLDGVNLPSDISIIGEFSLISSLYAPININLRNICRSLEDGYYSFVFYNIPSMFTATMQLKDNEYRRRNVYSFSNKRTWFGGGITGIMYSNNPKTSLTLNFTNIPEIKNNDCCCGEKLNILVSYDKIEEHFLALQPHNYYIARPAYISKQGSILLDMELTCRANAMIPDVDIGDKYKVRLIWENANGEVIRMREYVFSIDNSSNPEQNVLGLYELPINPYDGIRHQVIDVSTQMTEFIPLKFDFSNCDIYLNDVKAHVFVTEQYIMSILDMDGNVICKGTDVLHPDSTDYRNRFFSKIIFLKHEPHILRVYDYKTGKTYETDFEFDDNGMISLSSEIRLYEVNTNGSQTTVLRINCFVADSDGNEVPNVDNSLVSYNAKFNAENGASKEFSLSQMLKAPTDFTSNVNDITLDEKVPTVSVGLQAATYGTISEEDEGNLDKRSIILQSHGDIIDFNELDKNKNIQVISEDSLKKVIEYRMPLRRVNIGVMLAFSNKMDDTYYYICIVHLSPDGTINRNACITNGVTRWIRNGLEAISLCDGDHIYCGAFDKIYSTVSANEISYVDRIKIERDRIISNTKNLTFDNKTNTLTIDLNSINTHSSK